MKYYIIAVVLIVALAGLGVQLLGANTGMAVTPASMRIGSPVNWDAECGKLKTEINSLASKYKGDCDAFIEFIGLPSELICPCPGLRKTGYKFYLGTTSNTIIPGEEPPPDPYTHEEQCRDIAIKIVDDVIQLEKYAAIDKGCDTILHNLRAPYGCSIKAREYVVRD